MHYICGNVRRAAWYARQLKWEPESLPQVSAASTQPDAWSGDLLVYGIFADAFEKKEGEGGFSQPGGLTAGSILRFALGD